MDRHTHPLNFRVETDSLGQKEVPGSAYYGAQTARALSNFAISGISIVQIPALIHSLAQVKKAVARANVKLGNLSAAKGTIIEQVCDEIIAGELDAHFPVDVFQGGAGTSTNMNINEVIANRGLELMGHPRGSYDFLHPNNDVNLSQSTNDVYPTAVRLAVLTEVPKLAVALAFLADAFEDRALRFSHVLKLGRTQLQDAVSMTVGQEFRAFSVTIRDDIQRLEEAAHLLHEINLGGTAIGTGITADPRYQTQALLELKAITGIPLKSALDLVEASWDTGSFVHFSGTLKRIAVKLSKISNDLRLLSSGPRGGIAEIRLPAVQPGSSIMPGKVNPVIPEVVNLVAFHVFGADVSISFAAEAGQLQLNAFEPLIAYKLLQSLTLLSNCATALARDCVQGIEVDEEVCRRNLEASPALATALIPIIGYDRAAQLAKKALLERTTLRDLLLQEGDLAPERVDSILDVIAMTRPGRSSGAPPV